MGDVGTLRDVSWFDHAPSAEAAAAIRPACSSTRWVGELVMARPWVSLAALVRGSDAAVDALGWSDIEEALAAHPRIGERAQGTDAEAGWSRAEQAAAASPGAVTAAELGAANAEYEARFGFVFLICATGRSANEILLQLRARLGNDPLAEHEVVRRELRDIVRLRLSRVFG